MKRILHVVNKMDRGGIETFIMNVYRNLDHRIYQFDFLVSSELPGDYDREILNLGGRIFKVPPRRSGYLKRKKALHSFFANNSSDFFAVHLHASSLTNIDTLCIAKQNSIAVRVIHAHSTFQKGSKIHLVFHLLNKIRIRSVATKYLACSDLALNWFYKGSGVYKDAIILNNAIEGKRFIFNSNKRIKVRTDLGLSGDQLVIGHVGRFNAVKNHKFIVSIFKEIVSRERRAHLLLIGTGELMEEMKLLVGEYKLENNVSFLGLRSDIEDMLQAMDVFLFPSLYEGLPVALIEAQASGLITFASDTISPSSNISDLVTFLPLSLHPGVWAQDILSAYQIHKRNNIYDKIVAAGYDIDATVNILKQSVYVE